MNTIKIEIGGNIYTLLFGFTCYTMFMDRCFKYKDTYLTPFVDTKNEKGEDVRSGGELTILGLSNLFHTAYLGYCYDKGIDINLSYDDFLEWTMKKYETEQGQEEVGKVLEVWAKSKKVKELREDLEKKSPITESGQNQILTT